MVMNYNKKKKKKRNKSKMIKSNMIEFFLKKLQNGQGIFFTGVNAT
jgi:hypothetical protein